MGIAANRVPALRVGSHVPRRGGRWERGVTPYKTMLVELLDLLEATLQQVRDHLAQGRRQAKSAAVKAVETFAHEAFRDRDA